MIAGFSQNLTSDSYPRFYAREKNLFRENNLFRNKTQHITNRSLEFNQLHLEYFDLDSTRTVEGIIKTQKSSSSNSDSSIISSGIVIFVDVALHRLVG